MVLPGLTRSAISICYATGNISGIYGSIGGIVGSNGAGYKGPGKTINCYSTGNINATDDAGGVAGSNNDTILYCYATGKVTGGYIGGVVGNNYEATVIQCNWNKETTGLISGHGDNHSSFSGSGLTTVQMQKTSSFTGWDFNKVWVIRTDSTYPGLRGIDNAPFALPDFLKSNRTFTLSRLLLNDYDLQSVHKNLVLKIIRVSEGTTDSVSKFTFPANVSNDRADTLYYRVGKALVADTLWGNTAKSVITLDETFTSVGLYPEESLPLIQNYPNPFTSTTTIRYKVTGAGFVSLKVFNTMGGEVGSLVNERKPVGEYSVDWNATELAKGIYFCRMQAGSFSETRKLILQK
ncbi:MAG: T9SS type A sorting domain-containing protein [Bacteroidales bacterium]|nr:T9SS type A sorting domain-containing protein [Bacteroidales bacterium]